MSWSTHLHVHVLNYNCYYVYICTGLMKQRKEYSRNIAVHTWIDSNALYWHAQFKVYSGGSRVYLYFQVSDTYMHAHCMCMKVGMPLLSFMSL